MAFVSSCLRVCDVLCVLSVSLRASVVFRHQSQTLGEKNGLVIHDARQHAAGLTEVRYRVLHLSRVDKPAP